MGVLDSIFGSGSTTAVPGGNLTKPIIIALLGLLASRPSADQETQRPPAPPAIRFRRPPIRALYREHSQRRPRICHSAVSSAAWADC